MTRIAVCFLLAATLVSCKKATPNLVDAAQVTQAQTPNNPALAEFFDWARAEQLRRFPISAAYAGEPHDDTQWNPVGDEGDAMWLAWSKEQLAKVVAIEGPFSKADELNLQLFTDRMQQDIDGARYDLHQPVINHFRGTHTWVPSFLMTVHRIEDEKTASSWIKRLQGAGPMLDVINGRVIKQAEMDIRPPKFSYGQMIDAIDAQLQGEPFTDEGVSPLLAHFDSKAEAAGASHLRPQVVTALKESLGPAYQRLRNTLNKEVHNATNDGVWSLPQGDAYYAHRLKMITTTDLSADEIHQIGLDEVARIHAEMMQLAPKLGVDGDLNALFDHLRTSPKYTLDNTDEGRAAYLKMAEDYIAGFEPVLALHFEHLPTQPLNVRRVEEWREKNAGKAFYQGPSTDGKRPGIFYANLYEMDNMPTYQLEALVYHEGIPGHHMQNAVSRKLEDLPPFRRFGHVTAYGEGWGLYSELLPKELGFYTDPASDVGRLAMELWRATRLVVDTGLHHKRWSREEAIEYLVDNTPNPEDDCRRAIERYLVLPGQATAYKIGMLHILRLRKEAKAALGDKFTLKGFHGVILGTGPVPLDVMEDQVQAWVASVNAQSSR